MGHFYKQITGYTKWENVLNVGNPAYHSVVNESLMAVTSRTRNERDDGKDDQYSMRALKVQDLKSLFMYYVEQGWTPRMRRDYAMLLIGFLCLLRGEEVRHIRTTNLKHRPGGRSCLELCIVSRKTHSNAEQVFMLYENSNQPWLCPVRAVLRYIHISGYISNTFLFRSFSLGVFSITNSVMPHTEFLQVIQDAVAKLGFEAERYGTHSLRRGGVQYFSSYQKMSVLQISAWAGWSLEFNLKVIMRYLQLDEDPTELRELTLHPSNLLYVSV